MENDARLLTGIDAQRALDAARRAAPAPRAELPMQDPLWLATCAEMLAEPAALTVAVAGPASAPDALAAFMRRDERVSRLEPLGARELFEPCDAWARDAQALDTIAMLLARAGLPLLLPRVPRASAWLDALSRSWGRGVVLRDVLGTPQILLPQGAALSSSLRSDLRRARRRAEAMGAVEARVFAPRAENLEPLWEDVLRVEAAGWKGREGSALARDRRRAYFFRALAQRAAARGELRIATLSIGARITAVQLALEWKRRYWLLKIGYDEAFRACSPGMLLLEEAVRDAAARGLDAVELLGQREPWTARWTDGERALVAVRAYAASRSGIAAFATDAAGFAWRRVRGAS